MKKIAAIYRKEMTSYFSSPTAYIFVVIFLIIAGLFFWVDLGDSRQASLRHTFMIIRSILLFVTPMLTMRLFAEEKKSGTLELLYTSPLSNLHLVCGKFLACLSIYLVMFTLTFAYPTIMFSLGEPEFWPIASGYIGLFFIAGCYTAVGLFSSSLSENQLISGIFTFGILLSLLVIDWLVVFVRNPYWSSFFNHLSFFAHGESFDKGVLNTVDLTYYLGFIAFFIFLSIRSLTIQRSH